MKSESQLAFLQKITRRLAEAFSEVNSMCLAQIANLKAAIQESDEAIQQEEELVAEQEVVAIAEVEEVIEQEKQTDRDAKTKKIRKEEDVQNRLKKKGKKVSNKPKAPPSSFLIFFKQQQPIISKSYPTYGVTELTKVAAQCWKDLSTQEKQPYIRQCDEERKVYQEKMIKYRIDFPEEIAQRQKGRKQPRKDKKGVKDTPRKQVGVVGEPEPPQQQLPQEQSQSLSEQNPDDSLGFL